MVSDYLCCFWRDTYASDLRDSDIVLFVTPTYTGVLHLFQRRVQRSICRLGFVLASNGLGGGELLLQKLGKSHLWINVATSRSFLPHWRFVRESVLPEDLGPRQAWKRLERAKRPQRLYRSSKLRCRAL